MASEKKAKTAREALTPRQRELLASLRSKPTYAGSGEYIYWEGVADGHQAQTVRALAEKGYVELSDPTGMWVDLKVRAIKEAQHDPQPSR